MTVSSAVSSVNQQGNGATTVFPFPFYVSDQAYLVVQIVDNSVTPATTTTLLTSQYSVTGIGNALGGAVTYTPAIPSTKRIIISRVLPYTQGVSLTNQDGFFPKTVEGALDYLTYLAQQLNAQYTNLNIATGNVPSPTAPQVGYVLTAINVGGFAWQPSGAPDLSVYMLKANSLSDVASVSTARSNLGLGTAAQFNVGTGGSQVVQLDASAKLPAVDGSQLTNLPSLSTTGVLVGIQSITASGTYTRSAGVTKVEVLGIGGGGGGGNGGANAAGGGGSGEVRIGVFSPGPTESVTIGAGGANGSNGVAGGDTIFGSFMTCKGGSGSLVLTGGAPGTGGSGGIQIPSGRGQNGGSGATFGFGQGGGNILGPGAAPPATVSAAIAGTVPGTGGTGGNQSTNGAAGRDGILIIREYK